MSTPKKPQDHLKRDDGPHPDEPFEFEHGGKVYQLAPASEKLTVGFARANRRRSLDDQLFTVIEALADKEALAAIDEMGRDEFQQWQEDFFAHTGVTLGE